VVIAVVAVTVVEASVDEVVDVIAVRDEFVSTVVVGAGAFDRGAGIRVDVGHFDDMLVEVAVVAVVEMPVVEVIDVVAVLDARVAAVFAVDVDVIFVGGAVRHGVVLSGG
jgi:hypothetical protein